MRTISSLLKLLSAARAASDRLSCWSGPSSPTRFPSFPPIKPPRLRFACSLLNQPSLRSGEAWARTLGLAQFGNRNRRIRRAKSRAYEEGSRVEARLSRRAARHSSRRGPIPSRSNFAAPRPLAFAVLSASAPPASPHTSTVARSRVRSSIAFQLLPARALEAYSALTRVSIPTRRNTSSKATASSFARGA